MVNHCCIQYCKQDNAGLEKKFRLSSDPSIRQSWIEVIEKVNEVRHASIAFAEVHSGRRKTPVTY